MLVAIAIGASAMPAVATAEVTRLPDVRADLDGRAIPLSAVGRFHCHDFAYPVIHCFASSQGLDTAVEPILATTALDYVAIFEFAGYGGAAMYVSSDYTVLATIGWNDRISSFKARNSLSGRFWTDWFYTGSQYAFCCNTTFPSLGSWDNTFSSVQRT